MDLYRRGNNTVESGFPKFCSCSVYAVEGLGKVVRYARILLDSVHF